MQQWRPESGAMTFDEVSMERSKGFVKALQELKNLRPQLYSAAEYCEKSYLHSEQKQMVIDNLKDYAVRALVNAVDHLGTVAYKLTDLFEQQASEVSNLELKITPLNQQILTYQIYTDKEGLREHQMFGTNPRHHKHYILPNSGRRTQSMAQLLTDPKQDSIQAKARPHPLGIPGSKTLSWHLSSETHSASDGAPQAASGIGESKPSKVTTHSFHLLGTQRAAEPLPLSRHLQLTHGHPTSDVVKQTFGARDVSENAKHLSAFRSFENPRRHEIQRAPVRSKSVLASLFAKTKSAKLKKISAT
ncbi:probable protein ABIL1 [Typha angustifolia]|uniref:probable protein ABIL1 n=1 Tax=Typha angustifolia TaxID=59011 RepID=UPI003C2C8972